MLHVNIRCEGVSPVRFFKQLRRQTPGESATQSSGLWAEAEPIASTLRIFPGGSRHGDPYVLATTVRYLSCDSIELMGFVEPSAVPMVGVWRAIAKWCKANGIKRVLIVRYENGKRTERWLTE